MLMLTFVAMPAVLYLPA